MSDYYDKISRILRTDKDIIIGIEEKMEKFTKKKGVLEKISHDNDHILEIVFEKLKIKKNPTAIEIYRKLIKKVGEDDKALFEALGRPVCTTVENCRIVLEAANESADVPPGFFLKTEKAKEFLEKNPPKNILKSLKYNSVSEMMNKESLFEVYAALRFAEDPKWLNEVFFKGYKDLTPNDFELRPIYVEVLSEKWVSIAKKFQNKKYHNVSHLKELGILFFIPEPLDMPGETLRLFSLMLHYLHEISFYSNLFENYAKISNEDGKDFADLFISALRGDVIDKRLSDGGKINWLIIQQYLAKKDQYDWRLFEPHVNPEALHWQRAEENISHLGEKFDGLDLSFWHNLDAIGDYFPTEVGANTLVSYNLVDTVMSLVKEKELIKYLYHHQEALWNKIFTEYIGEDEMRRLIIDNFSKGYINFV